MNRFWNCLVWLVKAIGVVLMSTAYACFFILNISFQLILFFLGGFLLGRSIVR